MKFSFPWHFWDSSGRGFTNDTAELSPGINTLASTSHVGDACPARGSARKGQVNRKDPFRPGWWARRGRFSLPWIVVAICWLLPLVVLIVIGSLWLYWEGWLLWWFVGAAVAGVLGWVVAEAARRRKLPFPGPVVEPALDWPPIGVEAWEDVERLATEAESNPPPLNQWQAWEQLCVQVVEAVARHYYPSAKQPLLEVSVPRLLRVIELAARDFRKAIRDHVPLADKLTIGDFHRAQGFYSTLSHLYQVYRVVAMALNPLSGAMRMLRDAVVQGLQQTTAQAVVAWAAGYLVRRTGYYAIMLYGGYLILDEEEFKQFESRKSVRDKTAAGRELVLAAREPFRILVVGRMGAGKSSVINALAGQALAPLNCPNPRQLRYIVPWGQGGPECLVIEAPDLQADTQNGLPSSIKNELSQTDLVMLVVKANQAELSVEQSFVREFRRYFAENRQLVQPPLLVVVTRADCETVDNSERQPGSQLKRILRFHKRWLRLKSKTSTVEVRLREALNLEKRDQLVLDCFLEHASDQAREQLLRALKRVQPLMQVAHRSRVQRHLRRFSLHRDVWQPVLNWFGGFLQRRNGPRS